MVKTFSFHLNRSLQDMSVPPAAMQELRSNEIRLAALGVPPGIDAEIAAAIRISIERAFVFAFRLVLVICAGLSIASTLFAWRMIESPSQPRRQLQVSEAAKKA
jgi:hypothetical protein